MPDTERVTIWACRCCDAEAPTWRELEPKCECPPEIRWVKAYPDTEIGRQRIASDRETYRSDLLK